MTSAITTFVLNAAWQSTVLAAAGLLIDRLLLRSLAAHIRFTVLVAALMLATLVPLGSVLPRVETKAPARTKAAGVKPRLVIDARVAGAVTLLELAAIAIALTRLVRRSLRTRELMAASHRIELMEALYEAQLDVAPQETPPLRTTARAIETRFGEISAPLTAGILAPVIILPPYLLEAENHALLIAALRHELAHIRRRDTSVEMILRLITIPLAWHPAVAILHQRIAALRELACDDAAARESASDYARALVAIAQLATARRPDLALAMSATALEMRVAALRNLRRPRRPRTALAVATLSLALLTAASCRNAAEPVVGSNLSGRWELDRNATTPKSFARQFDAYSATLKQHGKQIDMEQMRVVRGRPQRVSWSVIVDGVARPVNVAGGGRGSAVWQGERLHTELVTPDHVERGVTYLDADTLVWEGTVQDRHSSRTYHVTFRRSR